MQMERMQGERAMVANIQSLNARSGADQAAPPPEMIKGLVGTWVTPPTRPTPDMPMSVFR